MPDNQIALFLLFAVITLAAVCAPTYAVLNHIREFDKQRDSTKYLPRIWLDWGIQLALFCVAIFLCWLVWEEAVTYTPPPKNNLIILDIDGVLNHNKTEHRQKNGTIGWSAACVAQLNRITQANPDTSIVICSAWRIGHTLEYMQALAKEMGIEAPVIGITPSFNHDRPRDDEITSWLTEAKGEWDAIIVIDDDRSERFRSIQIKPSWEHGGLLDAHADRAIMKLERGLPENFDIGRLDPTCKSEIKKEMSFGGQRVPTTLLSE